LAEATQPEVLVEAALEQLVSWPGLSRSPQLAKFLNYIVRAKLRGDEASIKAYAIAVDVFGRPQTFDPQTDPIVRVQARRLRAALDEYYAGEGASSPVRISLPVGRYVPEFRLPGESRPESVAEAPPVAPAPPAPPIQFRRRQTRTGLTDWMLYALVLVVGLGIIVVLAQVLMPRPARIEVPQEPSIGIAEFTAISSGQGQGSTGNIAGLAIELVTDLQLFDDIKPTYIQGEVPDGDGAPQYVLTGIARQEAGMVQVTASLRRNGSDAALWSYTRSVKAELLETSIDDLSQAFAEQLGSHRGPLFDDANKWLDANLNIAGNETVYLCGLLFTRYRDSAEVADAARARDCVSSVLARGDDALGFAFRGGLLLDDVVATQPVRRDPEPLAEAGRLLTQAIKLDATSSTVWREYARYLYRVGRLGESEAAYASALQLNPANLDAVAGYGRMLSVRGPSAHGQEMSTMALNDAVKAPHWYYAAPAINALRNGSDSEAIAFAEKLVDGDAELASVIGTVAAFRSGYETVLNRYFAQLLDVTRFRRFGILPVLRQRIPDDALVSEIAAELKRAGVSDVALNGSF
jgi:tetratricopeptide (TPR) repeat protein